MAIKYAILGLLSWKPATGYELKKVFENSASMYWSGNNNQIYKALLELQEDGLVTNETTHQDRLPSKKIYTITSEGLVDLKAWVLSSADAPEFRKPFLIHLAWSDLLTNQELFALLTKYQNDVTMQLILHQEKIKRGTGSPARTQRESFLWNRIDENILSSYQNELEWIQKLISQLFEHELSEEKKKMNYEIVKSGDLKYVELTSCAKPICTEQDALDLVALCGEHDTNLLLLYSEALSDDFFKLKTGVAGKVLQKFTNYHVIAAAVISKERVQNGKFKSMVAEANRGSHFRVFSEKYEAEKWLLEVGRLR